MVPLAGARGQRPLTDAEPVREDAWLTGVLGYPALRLAPTAAAVEAAWARNDARLLAFTSVPTADVAAVAALTAAGLYVVDAAVTLTRPPKPVPGGPANVEITTARPEEADAIGAIAAAELRTSRFHMDPRIDAADADRVKCEWARNCVLGGRGEEVLVARAGGRPAGFLAVLAAGDDCVIDLIAVAADHRRAGVGRALVAAFAARHARARELRVGTQAANVDSLRFYTALGFRPVETRYVLHGHRGGGA